MLTCWRCVYSSCINKDRYINCQDCSEPNVARNVSCLRQIRYYQDTILQGYFRREILNIDYKHQIPTDIINLCKVFYVMDTKSISNQSDQLSAIRKTMDNDLHRHGEYLIVKGIIMSSSVTTDAIVNKAMREHKRRKSQFQAIEADLSKIFEKEEVSTIVKDVMKKVFASKRATTATNNNKTVKSCLCICCVCFMV